MFVLCAANRPYCSIVLCLYCIVLYCICICVASLLSGVCSCVTRCMLPAAEQRWRPWPRSNAGVGRRSWGAWPASQVRGGGLPFDKHQGRTASPVDEAFSPFPRVVCSRV